MSDQKLQVVPLGGLGEFGMNSMAIRYGDDIIVVDAGMMFPDAELLGVDIVTPDFSYLEQHRTKVRGLILTHGHEDHIGAVPFLLSEINMPVYSTAFTLALVERRLEEHGLLDQAKLHRVKPGTKIDIGPFSIDFIHVTHSIVSSMALAITTPLGVIIHTGDFKVDPTPTDNELFDLHTLADYGKRGVLLLMSDSDQRRSARATPKASAPCAPPGRHLLSRRAAAGDFVLQLVHPPPAADPGRLGGLRPESRVSWPQHAQRHRDRAHFGIAAGSGWNPAAAAGHHADRAQQGCVVASGTQGEPMSALSRVAVDNHKNLSVQAGDTVVLSARIIPGNEKGIYRMINHFAKRGADVIYGSMNPPVHVSGHGSVEELKLVLNLVRPRYFVPVHGEYRQLAKHASLAQHLRSVGLEDSFVLETGETLEIDRQGARRGEKVQVGRVCIDSGTIDEVVEDIVIRDRRHLIRGRLCFTDHRHQQALRQKRNAAGDREPRIHVFGGRLGPVAGSTPGGGPDGGIFKPGGTHRLGRDAGKDPRRPEALPEQTNPAPPPDHARNP